MPLWSIVALVAIGVGAGTAAPGRFSNAFSALTLYAFLPPLLFEAAWNLDARRLAGAWKPIFALAVPGVAITTGVVGVALALAGVAWGPALLVGAIVSATDPIAVVAIFRRVNVPPALRTIVQSEALLNDAMAVVLYRAMLVTLVAGATTASIFAIVTQAVLAAAGGVLLGIALAVPAAFLAMRYGGMPVQVVTTLAGAYASYLAGDALHLAGIFSVIAFGITLREIERRTLSLAVADGVERFWDLLAVGANACVFFLTGTAIDPFVVGRPPIATAAALAGVLIARLVLAYILTPLAMGKVKVRWLNLVRTADARGALSLALAIALPLSVHARGTVIGITVTIVLATLLLSTVTVPRALAGFEPKAVV